MFESRPPKSRVCLKGWLTSAASDVYAPPGTKEDDVLLIDLFGRGEVEELVRA